MPPAFVLSQNQTLKLMSDHRRPGENPDIQGRLQGAVPAHYILLWICIETYRNGIIYRPPEALKHWGAGAAAHMSLHLYPQCKRADASPPPFYRGTGLPIDATRTGRPKWPVPPLTAQIWSSVFTVHSAFRKFPCSLSKQ